MEPAFARALERWQTPAQSDSGKNKSPVPGQLADYLDRNDLCFEVANMQVNLTQGRKERTAQSPMQIPSPRAACTSG